MADLRERCVDERGLPRAGFADANGDAVVQIAQHFAMARREKQKLRVRRQLERQFTKSVEGLIHKTMSSVPAIAILGRAWSGSSRTLPTIARPESSRSTSGSRFQ